MMFVSDPFWVTLVTTHMPLSKVSKNITRKKFLSTMKLAYEFLCSERGKSEDWRGRAQSHAGEAGIFGKEEKTADPAWVGTRRNWAST